MPLQAVVSLPDAIRGFLSPRPALGAVVPPTRPPGTFFHGLMFWLQMGRHKERAINSSRAPPPGLHDDRESQQRDSTCVNEPQRWQEERQAQLCLARMPAAVVPDTRPALHRRWEAHAEACTPCLVLSINLIHCGNELHALHMSTWAAATVCTCFCGG